MQCPAYAGHCYTLAMKEISPRARARNQLVFALCLLGVALAGYLATRAWTPRPQPAPEQPGATEATSSPATSTPPAAEQDRGPVARERTGSQEGIEGEYVCLPHKDTGGPQTLECALGLKADDGRYYAVSASGAIAESASATTPTGARVRLTGNVVPAPALSTTEWDRYDIAGVISVTTFTRL